MGFAQASVTVQVLLQRVLPFPLRVSISNGMVELKEDQAFSDNPKLKIWWKVSKILIRCLTVFSVVYSTHLQGHWREGNNMEQLCIYMIISCLIRIGSVTFDTLEFSKN